MEFLRPLVVHSSLMVLLFVEISFAHIAVQDQFFAQYKLSCKPGKATAEKATIKTIEGTTKIQCARSCFLNSCTSFNFKRPGKCELTKEKIKNDPCTGLIDREGWFNYRYINPCFNGAVVNATSGRCTCTKAWTLPFCKNQAIDCLSHLRAHGVADGNVNLYIKPVLSPTPFIVSCYLADSLIDIKDVGSAYVMANLGGDKTPMDFFNRPWEDYVKGFGDDLSSGRFPSFYWLGLQRLHEITSNPRSVHIMIILLITSDDQQLILNYDKVKVADESKNYALTYDKFKDLSGKGIEDVFDIKPDESPKHMPFSAKNKDNDKSASNCAETYGFGWWFNNCAGARLLTKEPYWNKKYKSAFISIAAIDF